MVAILLDAGPLVAFLNSNETHHAWVKAQFSRLTEPLLICEPVLTEVCYLLGRKLGRPLHALQLLERGVIRLGFDFPVQAVAVRQLFERYGNVPASLADACLIRMSELYEPSVVMTFDSDFLVYRRNGRKSIPVLMPESLKK